MPRRPRQADGGIVYHVLNRAAGRSTLFAKQADYEALERVLVETVQRTQTRLLAYCLMPNHWHLLLWPKGDGELSEVMRWMTVTHTQRWHAHHKTAGTGPLYQGRFKSFPVQADEHFLTVARYVERNPVRAGLVERVQDWRWSSLWARGHAEAPLHNLLSVWPVPPPNDWQQYVNRALTQAELEAVQRSVVRGQPLGNPRWIKRTAGRLGLESTMRSRGRPRKPNSDRPA